MIEATWIAFAFVMGLVARGMGLPPLVGYLGAGFALAGFGEHIGVGPRDSAALDHIAHLGVLLLLFTVGLKLKIGNLVRREVIGGGLLHFAISSLIFLPAILLLLELPWQQGLLLAIALSFSSTVLAAKVLEGKRELRAFHGRVAIGVLIIQDLIALVVMSLASGKVPSAWALLLFGLPLLRPLLFKLLDVSGHEELMVLLGLLLALVLGGYGFEQLGLSSELGALAFGAMLAKHKRATELANSLWGIKEIFLVGFFLQIGIGGLPDAAALKFALVMAVLLPLKGVLFFFLFLLFRLRARSAFLSSVSLTNYSEFGLIRSEVCPGHGRAVAAQGRAVLLSLSAVPPARAQCLSQQRQPNHLQRVRPDQIGSLPWSWPCCCRSRACCSSFSFCCSACARAVPFSAASA